MFQRGTIKRAIGSGLVLFATLMMIGIGGAVEAGSISAGIAFLRMAIGCVAILAGAALMGGID